MELPVLTDYTDLPKRVNRALQIAFECGHFDGAHHKAWVIDQIVQALSGSEYQRMIRDFCAGEDGPDTYEWPTGIAH